MMKLAVTATLLATVGVTCTASAQAPPQEQTIVRAGTQPSTQGPEQYFTGKVRVDPVFAARADVPYSAAYVTFEPGARSAWHTHPAGQRLIVTAGVGRTSVWGVPSRRQALAWRGAGLGDDPSGAHGRQGRQERAVAGEGQRRAVRPLISLEK
jgi:hypothetical protein